jgi:hypothetical protein
MEKSKLIFLKRVFMMPFKNVKKIFRMCLRIGERLGEDEVRSKGADRGIVFAPPEGAGVASDEVGFHAGGGGGGGGAYR